MLASGGLALLYQFPPYEYLNIKHTMSRVHPSALRSVGNAPPDRNRAERSAAEPVVAILMPSLLSGTILSTTGSRSKEKSLLKSPVRTLVLMCFDLLNGLPGASLMTPGAL